MGLVNDSVISVLGTRDMGHDMLGGRIFMWWLPSIFDHSVQCGVPVKTLDGGNTG